MTEAYQSEASGHERSVVLDSLEAYVRAGARQMLAAALDEEVRAFLGGTGTNEANHSGGTGMGTMSGAS